MGSKQLIYMTQIRVLIARNPVMVLRKIFFVGIILTQHLGFLSRCIGCVFTKQWICIAENTHIIGCIFPLI